MTVVANGCHEYLILAERLEDLRKRIYSVVHKIMLKRYGETMPMTYNREINYILEKWYTVLKLCRVKF